MPPRHPPHSISARPAVSGRAPSPSRWPGPDKILLGHPSTRLFLLLSSRYLHWQERWWGGSHPSAAFPRCDEAPLLLLLRVRTSSQVLTGPPLNLEFCITQELQGEFFRQRGGLSVRRVTTLCFSCMQTGCFGRQRAVGTKEPLCCKIVPEGGVIVPHVWHIFRVKILQNYTEGSSRLSLSDV